MCAVAILAALQYVFLAQLWRSYPLKAVGDVIHVNVVIAGLVLSLAGSVAITIASILHWRRGLAAAQRLEVVASTKTFNGIRATLARLAHRSTLNEPPELRYTPKNAAALEVREANRGAKRAVVVGLGQRKRQTDDPEAFAAQIGHELSHLELGTTAVEIGARRLVIVHFRILGWLLAVFMLVLGFIDRRGLSSQPLLWGFQAVWEKALYASMSYQLTFLALSSLVILVYSHFFAVRREHIHDFRGSQLAGSDALAARVFAHQQASNVRASAVADFVQLHPTASAREFVVHRRDFILLSAVLYPIVVAGAQPLVLLLMTGWRDVFGLERHWWNLAVTIAAGLVLYLVLCADIVRLGLGALLNRRLWLEVPIYAFLAGIATQIPRFASEIVFGLRKDFPPDVILGRIWTGVVSGGGTIFLVVALVLLALAYLAAVCIAATGEERAGTHTRAFHVVSGATTIGAFSVASLTSAEFIVTVLLLVSVIVIITIAYFALTNRCSACGRRRSTAVLLSTLCRCGHEELPLLRRWTERPYSEHITAPSR